MNTTGIHFTIVKIVMISIFYTLSSSRAEVILLKFSCYAINHEIILPGSPVTIYDAITGDISGWWDHSFSDSPLRFYMEPKPGGGFYEIFDEDRHLLVPFEENQKWGYKNNEGRVIVEAIYHVANTFNKFGIAAVVDDSGWIYIDKNGRSILRPFIIDNGPDYFSDGLARYMEQGKIGFMDENGVKVIPAIFEFVLPFSEGLAAFCEKCKEVRHDEYKRIEGGKWGYINKSGEIVVDPEYDKAGSFKDGQAEVSKGQKKYLIWKKDLGQ